METRDPPLHSLANMGIPNGNWMDQCFYNSQELKDKQRMKKCTTMKDPISWKTASESWLKDLLLVNQRWAHLHFHWLESPKILKSPRCGVDELKRREIVSCHTDPIAFAKRAAVFCGVAKSLLSPRWSVKTEDDLTFRINGLSPYRCQQMPVLSARESECRFNYVVTPTNTGGRSLGQL